MAVRPAAELAAVRGLHHAHLVVVFLAEERHRARRERILERHARRVDVRVLEDRAVHLVLHPLQLLRRQPTLQGEVEPQVRRMHERARLMHVLTEHAAERRVQEVRRGVVAHGVPAQLRVHHRLRRCPQTQDAVDDLRAHHDHARCRRLRVGDERAALVRRDRPAIAHLAAALRIEGRAVEDELDVGALVRFIDALAVDDERRDHRIGLELVVPAELASHTLGLLEHRVELAELHGVLRELRRRPAAAALRLELIEETVLVQGHARARDDLLGQLDRKAEGVVQAEGRVAVDEALPLRLRTVDRFGQHREAVRESALELRLLVSQELRDAVAR